MPKVFGMHLFETYIVNRGEDSGNQSVIDDLKPLFEEGGVSFTEFEELIIVNNSENKMN